MLIPVAGILYVIIGVLAKSGTVWVVGALIVGLIAVVVSGIGRGRTGRS